MFLHDVDMIPLVDYSSVDETNSPCVTHFTSYHGEKELSLMNILEE